MRNKNHTENAERPKDVCCFHFNQILMVSLSQKHNTYLILIISPPLQAKAYLENPEAFAVAAAPTADATPAAGGAPAAEEKAEEKKKEEEKVRVPARSRWWEVCDARCSRRVCRRSPTTTWASVSLTNYTCMTILCVIPLYSYTTTIAKATVFFAWQIWFLMRKSLG